jgi:hypothetical protein
MVVRAHFGPMTMPPAEISIDSPEFLWVREPFRFFCGKARMILARAGATLALHDPPS